MTERKPITPEELAELRHATQVIFDELRILAEHTSARHIFAFRNLVLRKQSIDSLILAAERLHAVEAECERRALAAREKAVVDTDPYSEGRYIAYHYVLDLIRMGRE